MDIKLTIRQRMLMAFGSVAVIVMISYIIVFLTLLNNRQISERNITVYNPSVAKINTLYNLINNSRMLTQSWVLDVIMDSPDKVQLKKIHIEAYPSLKKELSELTNKWRETDKQMLDSIFINIDDLVFSQQEEIMTSLHSFESYADPDIVFFINLLVEDDGDLTLSTQEVLIQIDNLSKKIGQNQTDGNKQMIDSFDDFQLFIVITSLILLVGVFVIAYFTIKNIVVPLEILKRNLLAKSEGDFAQAELVERNDEIGAMTSALSAMSTNITEIVNTIKASAVALTENSTELADSAVSIAEGAAQQASSTVEVSTSMEEITASIEQNSSNAQHTEKLAEKLSQSVMIISKSVNNTNTAMQDIIDKTLIVNDIAERIDLLAINASIEAARAGEYGKGFSVVASEIRKLAENSQKAANSIDEVSQSSVSIADKSSKLLKGLIPDIENTLARVKEISSASLEQKSGMTTINSSIMDLSNIAQHNSSASEKLSNSSTDLLGQAEKIEKIISFFKTKESVEQEQTKIKKDELDVLLQSSKTKNTTEENEKINIPESNKSSKTKGMTINMDIEEDDSNFEKF